MESFTVQFAPLLRLHHSAGGRAVGLPAMPPHHHRPGQCQCGAEGPAAPAAASASPWPGSRASLTHSPLSLSCSPGPMVCSTRCMHAAFRPHDCTFPSPLLAQARADSALPGSRARCGGTCFAVTRQLEWSWWKIMAVVRSGRRGGGGSPPHPLSLQVAVAHKASAPSVSPLVWGSNAFDSVEEWREGLGSHALLHCSPGQRRGGRRAPAGLCNAIRRSCSGQCIETPEASAVRH